MEQEVENSIYRRIGEFVVSFQWLENRLREIGWFILDPDRSSWPPTDLRNITNQDLIDEVHRLFKNAIPKCDLDADLESEFIESFDSCVDTLHQVRRSRNRILHSAYIELKAGREVQAILRSNPKLTVDESGEYQFDQEVLKPDSFDEEMRKMAESAFFLNRAYTQLIHRYPNGGA